MKIKKLAFCLILILSTFILVNGQDANKTSLNGRLMDTTGASAPGMRIIAQDKKGKTFEALTDVDGFYSINLSPGDYQIEVLSAGGLFGIKVENYKIAPTKITLDIVLEIDINAPTTNNSVKRKSKREDKENIKFLKQ